LDFDVYPIGGVVPLMERYRYADIVDATLAAKRHLPFNRPVHLFGCGHPMFFAQAALLGCDFFDSASYAKFADAGRMLLPSGTVHLKELRELPCECPVCCTQDVDSLLAMSESERALQLMSHNLYVSAAEMRRVRQAIHDGKLFELAAIRARSHPTLIQALEAMLTHMDQIVPFDPIANTSSVLYTGWETSMHPAIVRFHNRIINRYPFRNTNTMILVPHMGDRPYSETTVKIVERIRQHTPSEVILMFVTPFGIIPWEYEHVHPAQQCIYPKTLDNITLKIVEERVTEFLGQSRSENLVWLSRATPTDVIYSSFEGKINSRYESVDDIVYALREATSNTRRWERKICSLIAYQWNIDFPTFLENEDTSVTYSKATRKIRYVNRNNTIIFTLVPTSGLLTPTLEGGQELLQAGLSEQYTVTVDKDAAEFIAQGKSALAKFVEFAHPKLRAGEEVLLVNPSGDLLATGRTLLSGPEMMTFDRGVAVVTRHSRK
ncbi:MAG: tRNA-guanine transglycosylase, partial [Candidatus Thorarchaeota archaeon]